MISRRTRLIAGKAYEIPLVTLTARSMAVACLSAGQTFQLCRLLGLEPQSVLGYLFPPDFLPRHPD